MKDATPKSKRLWLLIATVAVVAAVTVAVAMLLPFGNEVQVLPQEAEDQRIFWNLDQKKFTADEELAGMSSREPAEDGMYYIRMACDGQILEMKVADKRLVNYIDTQLVMGLVFDAEGIVVDVLEPKAITTEIAKEFFVRRQEGSELQINSSMAMNGLNLQLTLTENAVVMDVREDAPELVPSGPLEPMDKVFVYGDADNNVTHVFLTERKPQAKVYVRVEQFWDSVEGCTTRVPDENGIYHILMGYEGEQVVVKCKDKDIANQIDSGVDSDQHKGLLFDEEGYVKEVLTAREAIKGQIYANVYNVTKIDGNTVTVTRLIGNEGTEVTFTINEETDIFATDTGGTFDFVGQRLDTLQLMDRVIVYGDLEGNTKIIYVGKRIVDVPMYYNVVRYYDNASKQTARTKTDGYYVFRMVVNGKEISLKTKDWELANQIDSNGFQMMGLEVEGSIIKKYYDPSCVSGFGSLGSYRYVTDLMGSIGRFVEGYDFTNGSNVAVNEDAVIYNVTGDYGTKMGQYDKVQKYDRVSAYRDVTSQVSHVVIQQRYHEGTKIYYNMDRRYDGTTRQTTRKPDADGYYVYQMFSEGKTLTLKTKNKTIANIIDGQGSSFAALKVSGEIIKAAYQPGSAIRYGAAIASSHYIGRFNDDGTFNTYYWEYGGENWSRFDYKLADNCKIYNISPNYNKEFGEKTKLQVGDQIYGFINHETGLLEQVYVRSRRMESPLYWNVQQKYNSETKETTRTPDADGYYTTQVYMDGKIKTFRTKDKTLMSKVDSYDVAFAMQTKGDIIQKASIATTAEGIFYNPISFMDVTALSGRKLTATRTRPAAENLGTVVERTISKKCKIYDMSFYSPNRGAEVKLQIGDRIVAYADQNSEIIRLYVVYRNTHADGYISHCPHCDKKVTWEPFVGSIYQTDAHYYLPADYTSGQKTVGLEKNEGAQYDVVFDLNGHTFTGQTRNFLVYDKLTVLDTVGGGKLLAPGVDGWAGNILVLDGGELTVLSGTIAPTEQTAAKTLGGLLYAGRNSKINLLGGTLLGGNATTGGAVYLENSKLYMAGGTVENCTAPEGGSVAIVGNSVAQIAGGTVTGGDIHVASTAQTGLVISGGKVSCDIVVTTNTNVALVGKQVLPGMLRLNAGAKVDVSQMTAESSVNVLASGVFTTEKDEIGNYINCFKPIMTTGKIKVEGKALRYALEAVGVTQPLEFVPGTSSAACAVCGGLVEWKAITGAEPFVAMSGSHYYLANDIAVSAAGNGKEAYLSISGAAAQGSICLHLNGHKLEVKDQRAIIAGSRQLNILGAGTVSGNSAQGSAIQVNAAKAAAQVNLYAGTYTKAASNTNGTILNVGENGGTLNMYADVLVDGTGCVGTDFAGCVNIKGGGTHANHGIAVFNMYGGTIQNGTATTNGGNLNIMTAFTEVNLYGGTITGGTAVSGGNIYNAGNLNLYGGTVTGGKATNGGNIFNAGTLKLTGDPELGTPVISGGEATNEGGNLRSADAKALLLRNVMLQGGTSGSHGGNVSITRTPTTIEEGTLIDGGVAGGQGGSLRVYEATVIMTGGEIKNGSCTSQTTHNVWLAAGAATKTARFYLLGGTVYATANTTQSGTALNAYQHAAIYLGGNATVTDTENTVAGIKVVENSKLYICDGWTGSANVRWHVKFAPGATVYAANGQVVTLDAQYNATAGGSFTGNLQQLYDGAAQVSGKPDGSLYLPQ